MPPSPSQVYPEASFFDWWIVVVARAQGLSLHYVAEPLVAYRRHAGAVTTRNASAPRSSSKTHLLQARYANAHALAHSTLAGDQTPAMDYLRAFEAWLRGVFPLTAAAYFWRHRKAIFWSTSLRQSPAIHAIRYVLGYRFRQLLRPRRHPTLLGMTLGKLQFDQDP